MVTTDVGTVTLRVTERHEIEIGKSHIPGLGRDGYFPVWRRPITEGRSAGCVEVIKFETYRAEPPGPRVRWRTESEHNIGLHRLVKDDDGRWHVELLVEEPLPPERLEKK